MLMLSIGGLSGWVIRGATLAPAGGLLALAQEASDSYHVYASDHTRPVELRDSTELAGICPERAAGIRGVRQPHSGFLCH